jgi:hypothetical protein
MAVASNGAHGAIVAERPAQVTARDVAHEEQELLGHRTVEAEGAPLHLPHLGADRRILQRAEQRLSRSGVEEDEGERGGEQHDAPRLQQSAGEEAPHA